jgi:multidrug efflux pump subunit AcrA (membrane-fusion protein)
MDARPQNALAAPVAEEAAPVAALEPALWKRLGEAADAVSLARAWIALQCQMVEGAMRGFVLLEGATPGRYEPVAFWPEGGAGGAALTAAADLAARERRGVASAEAGFAHIAYPILLGDELKGVAAVTLKAGQSEEARAALRRLQWGAAWIRDRLRETRGAEQERLITRSGDALALASDALSRESFAAAAMAVVGRLAAQSGCSRVSLGVRRTKGVQVKVISHSAQFGQRMALVSGLAAAMDEALDQNSLVLYPAPPDQWLATSAHEELSRAQRDGQVLTVPMLVAERLAGAIVFERPPDTPFDRVTLETLELATSIVGPILEEKRLNDRWLIVKAFESLARQLSRLFGPGHLVRKLVAIAVIAAAVALSVLQASFEVDADAEIQGLVRRAVVAPYDGFIKDSHVRAGDQVAQNQVLAELEDRDLLLERLKWVTERQQRSYEYDKALAARQPAVGNVAKAQMDQAEAQIKLVDAQLQRIQLRAPIDGEVVTGDLSQLIGTAVQRGQVLFEVAPLNVYRVVLDVDERDIDAVKPGQTGRLVVSALPTVALPFVIDEITPIAEVRGGRNAFRVEGRLTENPSQLRPGMQGVGKIGIGRRNLAWIWVHPLIDGVRLWAWRWTR